MGCLEDDLDYGIHQERKRLEAQRHMDAIYAEFRRAAMHGEKFASAHEAYAVILEELDEFWEIVRQKRKNRSVLEIEKELIQLGAMALKALNSIENFTGGKV